LKIFSFLGLAGFAIALQRVGHGADKPELTRIFPAGGQAGTVVEVEASGKFPVWPMQTWSETESIVWSAEEASGNLKATIDPNAAPGMHWLRLYHPSGATVVRPFLVSNAPEQIEVEPNNRLAEANAIMSLPHVVHGALNKRGEVDMFSLVLSAGQRLVATVDAEQMLHSPLDASLQLLDSEGFLLKENLDRFGLDPSLEFTAPRDGKYVLRVFGFPATPDQTIAFGGGDAWIYRLRIQSSEEPFASATQLLGYTALGYTTLGYKAQQLGAGQATTRETALALDLPTVVAGTIDQPSQRRFLRFQAAAGQLYRMQVFARERGSELDATIAVLDAQGKQLTRQDDTGNERDPDLKWKASTDGEYHIEIQDFHKSGGAHFDFELAIGLLLPDFALTIPNDLIQTTVGKGTEIEVAISRECDFAGDIAVSLEGGPEGVECPTVLSVHGKDTAKKIALQIKSSVPFQGPVRIVARAKELGDAVRYATAAEEKPIWLSSVAE
jgi:hypothetical protein